MHPFDLPEPLSDKSKIVLLDLAILSDLYPLKHLSPNHKLVFRSSHLVTHAVFNHIVHFHLPRFPPLPISASPSTAAGSSDSVAGPPLSALVYPYTYTLLVAFPVDLFDRRQKTLQRCSFHTCVHPSTPRARRHYWRKIATDGELPKCRYDRSPQIRRPCCRPCFVLLVFRYDLLRLYLGFRRHLLHLLGI